MSWLLKWFILSLSIIFKKLWKESYFYFYSIQFIIYDTSKFHYEMPIITLVLVGSNSFFLYMEIFTAKRINLTSKTIQTLVIYLVSIHKSISFFLLFIISNRTVVVLFSQKCRMWRYNKQELRWRYVTILFKHSGMYMSLKIYFQFCVTKIQIVYFTKIVIWVNYV